MPFKSVKQKKWMYANKPSMAKKWSSKYGRTARARSASRKSK